MVQIKLFKDENIHDLSFIAHQDKLDVLVVAPNPQAADEIRIKIIESGAKKVPEVITISKFMKDQLAPILGESGGELKNKAKLLLTGASLWKSFLGDKHKGDMQQELFFKAFSLFTELRGFSLNLELIRPVLDEYPTELKEFVIYFYQVMDSLGYIDEHKAYRMIADHNRELEAAPVMKSIVFWDFLYLSGSQIDMINALSTKHQVIIPYHQDIYAETTNCDWIRWFLPEALEVIQTSKELKPLKVVTFPKKKLNLKLNQWELNTGTDILFCTKKLSEYEIFDLPFAHYYFKTANSLFETEHSFLTNYLELKLRLNKGMISTQELAQALGQDLSLWLKVSEKNFRRLKVFTDMLQLLEEYFALSDKNRVLGTFDMKVLLEVMRLNLPRTFFTPVINEQYKGQLLDLSRLHAVKKGQPLLVCASSDYSSIKIGEEVYNEKVFEILSQLGPVKRNVLDFLTNKLKLVEILSAPQVTLFLENGLAKHDLGWSEILSSFELEKIIIEERTLKNKKSVVWDKSKPHALKSLSPSRLQTYIDCPQKYYYQYVEKLDLELELSGTVQKNELGTLEHAVIENYLKQHSQYSDESLSLITKTILNQFLQSEGRELTPVDYNRYFTEIQLYARHGIQYLLSLKLIDPELSYIFEHKLRFDYSGVPVNASVDCIVKMRGGYAVFDFKRSDASVPTKSKIVEMKKIQILFYLKFLVEENPNLLFFGYLNLSDLGKSVLFSVDHDLVPLYEQHKEVLIARLSDKREQDFAEIKANFDELWEKTVPQLKEEKVFSPMPAEDDVCTYCVVANVCSRGKEL